MYIIKVIFYVLYGRPLSEIDELRSSHVSLEGQFVGFLGVAGAVDFS